jgi:hypothetical protein
LLEGIPSALVGSAALFYLDNGPRQAKWLKPEERELLVKRLAEEETLKRGRAEGHHTLADAFRSRQVWVLCGVYFGIIMGNHYVSFWMPQIIKDNFSSDPWRIGLISMVPWGFGAFTMIAWGQHSDATGERRWHLAVALIAACAFLILGGVRGLPPALGLAALSLITAGIMSAISTFWAVPTTLLSGTAAAVGIARINSVGNLGGFVSPYAIGWTRSLHQSHVPGADGGRLLPDRRHAGPDGHTIPQVGVLALASSQSFRDGANPPESGRGPVKNIS